MKAGCVESLARRCARYFEVGLCDTLAQPEAEKIEDALL